MDYKIIFSEPAIDDLEGIVGFIANDNREAAVKFGEKLIESVRHLSKFPCLGRVVPEQMTRTSAKSFPSRIGFFTA